jgi:hypothetical protein
MSQALFVQTAIVLAATTTIISVAYYTKLTHGANWRDPLGLTIVLEAVLTFADIMVAIIRWFVHQTPALLSAQIWAQGSIIGVYGLVMAWPHRGVQPRPAGG